MKLKSKIFAWIVCAIAATALPFAPLSVKEAKSFIAWPVSNFGCPANAPIPACLAGYNVNTFHVDGTNNEWTTANVDQSNTYSTGFKFYYDQCFGQNGSVGRGNTTLGTTSVSVGEASGGYQANLASATCKGSSYIGTAFGGGGYFSVIAKWTATDCSATSCPSTWQAPLWLNGLECSTSTLMSACPWSGQASNYTHYAEFDINEMFMGNFGDRLAEWQWTLHDWYGLTTGKISYSGNGGASDPGQSSFSTYHKYSGLWKVATSTSPGYFCVYYDDVNPSLFSGTGQCTTWTQFINNGAQPPPPSGATPWSYGIADLQHFIMYAGCTNAFPCTIENIDVWQASSANNLHI